MRRAQGWNGTGTATFWSGGSAWPTAPTTAGTYEVHPRWKRDRKLEALNDAIGQLGMRCARTFKDESITTAQQTWEYTVPSSLNVADLSSVEIQIDTNAADIGFPYQNAMMYDWKFWSDTDASGNLVQKLKFGVLPPYPRTLRLRGWAWQPDLVADTDIFPYTGKLERVALAWVYRWADYVVNEWNADQQPAGQADRYRQRAQDEMETAKMLVLELMPPPPPTPVITPMKGQGLYKPFGGSNNPDFATILHVGG